MTKPDPDPQEVKALMDDFDNSEYRLAEEILRLRTSIDEACLQGQREMRDKVRSVLNPIVWPSEIHREIAEEMLAAVDAISIS